MDEEQLKQLLAGCVNVAKEGWLRNLKKDIKSPRDLEITAIGRLAEVLLTTALMDTAMKETLIQVGASLEEDSE